jgi:hypothetical protein
MRAKFAGERAPSLMPKDPENASAAA